MILRTNKEIVIDFLKKLAHDLSVSIVYSVAIIVIVAILALA